MDLAMREALREDAFDDVFLTRTASPSRPRPVRKCFCGWQGVPDRTQNSGGATNHDKCPACKIIF